MKVSAGALTSGMVMSTSHVWCITGPHDDVIKWKHFPRYWPYVRDIHSHRWIPPTKASDAEFWWFLWSALEVAWNGQQIAFWNGKWHVIFFLSVDVSYGCIYWWLLRIGKCCGRLNQKTMKTIKTVFHLTLFHDCDAFLDQLNMQAVSSRYDAASI